ncbi:Sodium/glucose cotransporter [Posidoniimonas polymericola]|uniref:Sodium/glucose cotransporter n=1 Tax=Posidoniimonas polymericola TaxID=2528002 RepID=A0A5C5XSK6_9BACT|nr:sodium:solute symporter family protein [Posidoniimonas polymericola]TWT66236.1 Sodium/glucose cotransporter [Posidoniimonas polymericola]
MNTLHPVDIAIIAAYLVVVAASGVLLSRRASTSIESYFLGGRSLPWWMLGVSNASGMFDITGTMWMVTLMFVYGVQSIWIPWLWPTFNQVFMMVFLAAWLRRSGALTGADWLHTRFGEGAGLVMAHLSVVLFALVTVIAFIAYAFVGVGRFAAEIFPWGFSPNAYAIVILGVTSVYVIAGGMYSVVLTDLLQFVLLVTAALLVTAVALTRTSPDQISALTPSGWDSPWTGWRLSLDWPEGSAAAMARGGYEAFGAFLGMALAKGILASIAGPTPGYDMQRVLAARNEREASLMSGIVSPVLFLPRYLLIASVAVLALVELNPNSGTPHLDNLLPSVIVQVLPVGLVGLMLAGLLAAFMSTFDSTVNSGAAYLVNDLYKRYLNSNASSRRLVLMSYAASIAVVIVGVVAGLNAGDINDNLQWIAAGLYGGYVAPNVLKWVWWRLNGAGYFAGMVTGVVSSLLLTRADWLAAAVVSKAPSWRASIEAVMPFVTALWMFPVLLAVSGLTAVAVSLLTPADNNQVLQDFYRNVRPWGFWGPIRRVVEADYPGFKPPSGFVRDMSLCAVGIIWQVALCAAPIYLVLQNWTAMTGSLLVVFVASALLKRFWYDRLVPAAD